MADKIKRAARERMAETGEPYTVARRAVAETDPTLGIRPGAMGTAWRELVDEAWPWLQGRESSGG